MRNDAEVISQSGKRIAAWDNQTIIKHAPATIPGAFFLATVCTLDIPFSLVADTLTSPLCILFTQENDKEAGTLRAKTRVIVARIANRQFQRWHYGETVPLSSGQTTIACHGGNGF